MVEEKKEKRKAGEPLKKKSEPAQKKAFNINILWAGILLSVLLAVSFIIALSVVSPRVQLDLLKQSFTITEEMKKEASNVVNQLKSATPELQKIIIELYDFNPKEQKDILEDLKRLKDAQEYLEISKKDFEESSKIVKESEKKQEESQKALEEAMKIFEETEEGSEEEQSLVEETSKYVDEAKKYTTELYEDRRYNVALEFIYESNLQSVKTSIKLLENDFRVRLRQVASEASTKDNLSYDYIELFIVTLIIAVTIGSILGLLIINIISPSQVKKDDIKIVGKSNNITTTYNQHTSIKGKNIIALSEDWRDVLWGAYKRLRNEEKNMQSRNVNNLITGVGSALLGFSWLLILIFLFNDAEYGDGVLDFLANYWARFSVVLILGLCAAFFLRLYTQTIRRIDKNRNEITNIELRLVSGLMLYDKTNSANFSALAKIIAQEERNFVLGKNESSGGIDPSKLLEIIKATK